MATPNPVKPRVLDARAYEKVIRGEVLNVLFANVLTGIDSNSTMQTFLEELLLGRYALTAEQAAQIPIIAQQQVTAWETYHRQRWVSTIRPYLGDSIALQMSQATVSSLVDVAIDENVQLISSLDARMRTSFANGIRREMDSTVYDKRRLERLFRREQQITGARAKLIARDQSSKVVNRLTQARHQEIGITQYLWRAVMDSRTRRTHQANNGRIFLWIRPPIETGHPGQEIQCRCLPVPVLSSMRRAA